jgi:hypothetical protein
MKRTPGPAGLDQLHAVRQRGGARDPRYEHAVVVLRMEAGELTQQLFQVYGDSAARARLPERPPVHADPHTMISL